jgi:hypothetical protein
MPFTQFKLGGLNIDTEYDEYDEDLELNNSIDESYRPSGWEPQYFQGITADLIADSSVEPILKFEQGFAVHTPGVTRTNFAGDDTWKVRVHPRIDSIDHSSGNVAGGQILTISGASLNSTDADISVLVDGINCSVDYVLSNSESITCKTGVSSGPSTTDLQPGTLGI